MLVYQTSRTDQDRPWQTRTGHNGNTNSICQLHLEMMMMMTIRCDQTRFIHLGFQSIGPPTPSGTPLICPQTKLAMVNMKMSVDV